MWELDIEHKLQLNICTCQHSESKINYVKNRESNVKIEKCWMGNLFSSKSSVCTGTGAVFWFNGCSNQRPIQMSHEYYMLIFPSLQSHESQSVNSNILVRVSNIYNCSFHYFHKFGKHFIACYAICVAVVYIVHMLLEEDMALDYVIKV